MKNITNFLTESSKSLKAAKLEGITGSTLYSELINSIRKCYEKDIKNYGAQYLIDVYEKYLKDADANKINPKATFIIVSYGRIHFKDKSIEQSKWDGKQYVITDEAINEIDKLFKTYWDKPVINGVRQSTKGHGEASHLLIFTFPDGTKLSTNLAFGAMQKLLKYATEKDYDDANIDRWEH